MAGAIHISLGELAGRIGELPRNLAVVTVCGSGYLIAASLHEAQGLKDISSTDGGMTASNRIKLPTVMP
ncbi:rhodanese-like domain-containing protein [Granulicella arctica]|uniref:rhodanese-like domain-containing protein n=1 Tax=Granulicella arctica TaxID=940613 RepID=UPI0037BE952F